MDIKIIEVKEYGNTLRVIVETEYGIDNIGLSIDAKYKDPFTGNPRWQTEVKELLEKKYPLTDGKIEVKEIHQEFKDQTFKLSTFDKAVPK
jgi:hypothetical protein